MQDIDFYYYQVAILGSPLAPLTYHSTYEIKKASVVKVFLQKRVVEGLLLKEVSKPEFKTIEIVEVLSHFDEKYLGVFNFLSTYYSVSLGEMAKLFTPFRSLDKKTLKTDIKIDLNRRQQEAFSFIKSNDISLLFGDTGSGKSEIYMKLFEDVLQRGESAIFLMPEISLTPQMKSRLEEKFGNLVAIWHSKITKKKKSEILEAIQNGEVRIIAGARSALFLALPNLSLIVVDEEHDESYKSSQRPRYHARDVAVYLSKALGIRVVLGSATPSLSSYHNYPYFRLKGTFYKSSKRYIFEEGEARVSEQILEEVEGSLKKKRQVIIFVPTRANFKYISCQVCGTFVECPYCSVGMSLHLSRNALVCHYCNFAQKIPSLCPSCSDGELRANRIGTAEVLRELSLHFPDATIQKFDTDEIKSQRKLRSVLKDFNDKKIDILVGTQMLSKGHNYLGVDLSIVIGIDSILSQSDYRARERAMSLLLQIAGRSGRSGEGRVLIQTQHRDFFERFLGDYEKFLKDEAGFRKELYPPFKRLMRVLVSDRDQLRGRDELLKVANCFERFNEVELVGAGEAGIAKIASKFRFNILLRSSSAKALLIAAKKCKTKSCEIDIDPITFS